MDSQTAQNILQLYYSGDPKYKLNPQQVDQLNAAAYPVNSTPVAPPIESPVPPPAPNQSINTPPITATPLIPSIISENASTAKPITAKSTDKPFVGNMPSHGVSPEVKKKHQEEIDKYLKEKDEKSKTPTSFNSFGLPVNSEPKNTDASTVKDPTSFNSFGLPVADDSSTNPTTQIPNATIPGSQMNSKGQLLNGKGELVRNAGGDIINDNGEAVDEDGKLLYPAAELDKKPPAPAGAGGTYIPPSNPLINSEKKWYEQNYTGTPEVKPTFSKAQDAQINLLSKNIKGYDETLTSIDKDSNMTEDTKNTLRTEVNTRRQKSQDYLDQINKNPQTSGSAAVPSVLDKAEQGIKDEADFNKKEANDISLLTNDTNGKLETNDAQYQAAKQIRLEKTKNYVDGLNKQADALANYKEDPQRFWNSKSTFQKVLMSIALVLGGANNKGINPAMSTLNGFIDKDIEAQRNEYNAKKNSFDAKRSLYGITMEQYKDPEAALAASKVILLDQSARKIEQLKTANQSTRVQQQADVALLNLQKNRADAEKAFAYRMYALQHPGTAGGGALNTSVVNDVAEGLGAADSYNTAATDILNLAKGGDVNLNPSVVRAGASGIVDFFAGNNSALETKYGKNGAAIINRIKQVVTENPVTGEHSDKDRDAAISVILGDGNPAGVAQRLAARAQSVTTKAQRKTQALPTKQQETLSNRIKPPVQAPITLQPRQK